MSRTTYPLLFHELAVGAVVNNILAEDWGGQDTVNFLGVHILLLAVQDEFVSIRSNIDGRFLSEKHKGEDVAKLLQCAQSQFRRLPARIG